MKPNFPSGDPEALEVQVTALLLGELSPAEAAELEQAIAVDPKLGELRARLGQTLDLVRAAVAQPATDSPATSAPLRLSEERRTKLLAAFQRRDTTPSHPPRSAAPPRRWFVPVALAASLMALGVVVLFTSHDPINQVAALRGLDSERSLAESVRLKDFKAPPTAESTLGLALSQSIKESDDRAADKNERSLRPSYFFAGGASGPAAPASAPPPPDAPPPAPPSLPMEPAAGRVLRGYGNTPAKELVELNTAPIERDKLDVLSYAVVESKAKAVPEMAGKPVNAYRFATAAGAAGSLPSETTNRQTEWFYEGEKLERGGVPALAARDEAPQRNALLERKAVKAAGKTSVSGTERLSEQTKLLTDLAPEGLSSGLQVVPSETVAGTTLRAEVRSKVLSENLGMVQADAKSAGGRATESRQAGRPVLQSNFDAPVPQTLPVLIPQPEVVSEQNAFSTFGLNVTDVSFKLAATSLQNNSLPDPGSVRSEEFLNAFQYRDPEPAPGVPVAFRSERARYPFAHDREVLRLSVKTAAQGREAAKPLNLVLLLDNSGSMERADRVAILRSMLQELARQLQPQDRISVVTFARTAQLRVDGLSAAPANAWIEQLGDPTPEGGTNLEEALKLGYATCARHFSPGGVNRVVLLTDGAANLGELDEQKLTQSVTAGRQQGLALDCFGVGWEGFNDQLLATLSKHGDGRYGFINSTEDAAQEFAGRLAGALQVAASDVKVQVQFNPQRTRIWRQVGYAQHQLTAQQFRDNTVDAAELGAAEAGQALYLIQVDDAGTGPIGTARVRFHAPGSDRVVEQEWEIPYERKAVALEHASDTLRLAAVAGAFAEWLSRSPFAEQVTLDRLLSLANDLPARFQPDPRPRQLQQMLQQARSLAGSSGR